MAKLTIQIIDLRRSITVMRKAAVLALTAVALTLSACNTVRGVGQDLQAAGEGVQCTVDRRC